MEYLIMLSKNDLAIKEEMFDELVNSTQFPLAFNIQCIDDIQCSYFDFLLDINYINEIHALKWIIVKRRVPEQSKSTYMTEEGKILSHYTWHSQDYKEKVVPNCRLPYMFFNVNVKDTQSWINCKTLSKAYEWIVERYKIFDMELKIECWKWDHLNIYTLHPDEYNNV